MTSAAVRSKVVALLLLSHCLLLLTLFLCFFLCVFGPCFVMHYLVSLLFLQSSILAEEERAGCVS